MEGMLLKWLLLIAGGALFLLMGLALLLLVLRDQHLQGLLQAQCQLSAKQLQYRERLEQQAGELQSALRAERAHVQQLRRKLQLLELLLHERGECPG